MDIVHKQVSLVHHVPSAESFQAYMKISIFKPIILPLVLYGVKLVLSH
jgi:hypothetical protein